jgi:hypothetical protein
MKNKRPYLGAGFLLGMLSGLMLGNLPLFVLAGLAVGALLPNFLQQDEAQAE